MELDFYSYFNAVINLCGDLFTNVPENEKTVDRQGK